MARGGSRGVKKQTLRDFTRELPSKEDQGRFREAMNADSDLVTAIIQAIEIDFIIEQQIISKLSRQDEDTVELLSKDNGALATFFSKIVLGYALGLYDKEVMEYMNIIRRIRNAFAHSRKDISFATPQIRAELASVKIPQDSELRRSVDIVKRLVATDMPEGMTKDAPDDYAALTGRAGFVILCMAVVAHLLSRSSSAVRAQAERFRMSTDPRKIGEMQKRIENDE